MDDNGAGSASSNDLMLVCEVCEKEGPKLVHYVDRVGMMDADRFLEQQDEAVAAEISHFVVRVLSADHHYQRGDGEWKLPPDCHVVLQGVQFLDSLLSAHVYHFTLPDMMARGHVRTFCIVYLTHQPEKLVPYFPKLKKWLSQAVLSWKVGSWRYFTTRARYLNEGAKLLLEEYKGREPTTPSGGWPLLNRLGLWRPGSDAQTALASPDSHLNVQEPPAAEGPEPPPPPPPVKEIAQEREELKKKIRHIQGICPKGVVLHEDPRAREGPQEKDVAAWEALLKEFILKTPAREVLPPLRVLVGNELWSTGMQNLLLVLQVMDQHIMDLALMEQDWMSVYTSPLPNTVLSFGYRLALGTDLQSYSEGKHDAAELSHLQSMVFSPSTVPHPEGVHLLNEWIPLKNVVFSLLKGRPVVVVGEEGDEETRGSVRWVVGVLRIFVPGKQTEEAVVPWDPSPMTMADLGVKLRGVPSTSVLKYPIEKYITILNLPAATLKGPQYRGKWLDDMFSPRKVWDRSSDEVFASYIQAWLLQIGLTAAVVYHTALIRGPLPALTLSSPSTPVRHSISPSHEREFADGNISPSSPFDPAPPSPNASSMSFSQTQTASVMNFPSSSQLGPALAAVPQMRLKELGVGEGDTEIIKYLVSVIRDDQLGDVDVHTSPSMPLHSPPEVAPRGKATQKPFPMISLDHSDVATIPFPVQPNPPPTRHSAPRPLSI